MKINYNGGESEVVIQSAGGTVRRVFSGPVDARNANFGVVNLNYGTAETHVEVYGDINGDLTFS